MILTDYYQHRPNDRRRPTKQASPSGQPCFVSPTAWTDQTTAQPTSAGHHTTHHSVPSAPDVDQDIVKVFVFDTVNCCREIGLKYIPQPSSCHCLHWLGIEMVAERHLPVVHTGAVPTGEMILSTRPGLTVLLVTAVLAVQPPVT